jgi:hypothetical protein
MVSKQVSLGVTGFLDSPRAAALRGVPTELVRHIAEDFVELCYTALGKEPRFLDAEDMRTLVVQRLPGRFLRKDPAAEHVPVVLDALLDHLAETTLMSQSFEVKHALPAASAEFLANVRAGRNEPEAPGAQDPFVHKASKVGRNDPCSCGSGLKYKKCHGKHE